MAEAKVAELHKQLTETVKQYEGKLATLSVFNDALQKENTQLRDELEESSAPRSATDQEVQELKQEFTRRMAAADKDISRLKEKNEQLRNKLNAVNQGGTNVQARLRDREDYINSLQAEGEMLARKNGELEATVRKLRAASRENEAERERLQSRLQQQDELLDKERERYERSAAASAQQIVDLQAELDDLQQRATEQIHAALQEGQAAARAAAAEAEKGGSTALQAATEREASLNAIIADLRAEHEEAESLWSQREEGLRREVVALENRLRQQELEKAEAVASASEGTRPLLRQIQSLAASAQAQEQATAEAERKLIDQLHQLDREKEAALEAEHSAKAQAKQAEASLAAAQKAVTTATRSLAEARQALDEEKRQHAGLQARLKQDENRAAEASDSLATEKSRSEAARQELQERLWEAETRVQTLSAELKQQHAQAQQYPSKQISKQHLAASMASEAPTLPVSTSAGQLAPRRSLDGHPDSFEAAAVGNRHLGGVEADLDRLFRSNEASVSGRSGAANGYRTEYSAEDSKAVALQRQLMAAEAMAERANEELLRACERAEAAQSDAHKYRHTLEEMKELKARHSIALELLGERNEKLEALEDDIREMKLIFHTQLSSLVDELNELKSRPKT